MAYSVESKSNNPANALRNALDQAERRIVQLNRDNVEDFLVLLDQIEHFFETIDTGDIDLRSEAVRWRSLLSRLNSKPQPLAAAAARAGGMATLRTKHPPADSFWWHLDAEVTKRRLQAARRAVTTLVILLVVVVGGYYLINAIFPPNPEAVRMLEVTSQLDELIASQQWEEALTLVKETQAELPNEVELVLWEVVFTNELGDTERAAAAWQRAQEMLPDQEAMLLVQLGTFYLQAGDLARAATTGNDAYALAPENPQVTFLLGNVAEAREDLPTAIAMFEKTYDLAEADNPQLAVIARVRLGNLLQRAPSILPSAPVTSSAALTNTTTLTVPLTPVANP
ncbi:MAG TPA: tetratricopeptide repeat protein [Caldilineaceae bacterium]|nr:tetratricopeptide repeat protein [Caldilineaceae bacterium]